VDLTRKIVREDMLLEEKKLSAEAEPLKRQSVIFQMESVRLTDWHSSVDCKIIDERDLVKWFA
jgi:hypothetical protein